MCPPHVNNYILPTFTIEIYWQHLRYHMLAILVDSAVFMLNEQSAENAYNWANAVINNRRSECPEEYAPTVVHYDN